MSNVLEAISKLKLKNSKNHISNLVLNLPAYSYTGIWNYIRNMERVAGGGGSLLSLMTSAALWVSWDGLHSFSPTAALRASANEMLFSAFIRCTLFSKTHLGHSLLKAVWSSPHCAGARGLKSSSTQRYDAGVSFLPGNYAASRGTNGYHRQFRSWVSASLFIHSFIHSSFITPTGSHIQIYSEVQFYNKLYLYTIGLPVVTEILSATEPIGTVGSTAPPTLALNIVQNWTMLRAKVECWTGTPVLSHQTTPSPSYGSQPTANRLPLFGGSIKHSIS